MKYKIIMTVDQVISNAQASLLENSEWVKRYDEYAKQILANIP